MKIFPILILCLLILISCDQRSSSDVISHNANPHAEGFNLSESDAQAITIADEVMMAMGGRNAWDNMGPVQWTFFGRRTHTWDKMNQRVHIDIPGQELQYDLNIEDMTGMVSRSGVIYEDVDSINHYLQQAKNMWINDSYWLFMPFKLKDSGVRLTYAGQDTTLLGEQSNLLALTFSDVGVTPQNKYIVYVDEEMSLVRQWDFYTNATDSLPRFKSPWPNYQAYEDLLLSGGAINGNNAISDIKIGEELRSVFR